MNLNWYMLEHYQLLSMLNILVPTMRYMFAYTAGGIAPNNNKIAQAIHSPRRNTYRVGDFWVL